jgi:cholesterol 24-hydroxylase
LYPAGAELSRKAPKDFYINEYFIPKGSWIEISPYSSGRYEKIFEKALDFNPDRFLASNTIAGGFTYAYFPFSRGPHNCIGQNFALIEAKIIIAKLIQSFNIQIDHTQSFEPIEILTLCPKDGTKCFLSLRNITNNAPNRH